MGAKDLAGEYTTALSVQSGPVVVEADHAILILFSKVVDLLRRAARALRELRRHTRKHVAHFVEVKAQDRCDLPRAALLVVVVLKGLFANRVVFVEMVADVQKPPWLDR